MPASKQPGLFELFSWLRRIAPPHQSAFEIEKQLINREKCLIDNRLSMQNQTVVV